MFVSGMQLTAGDARALGVTAAMLATATRVAAIERGRCARCGQNRLARLPTGRLYCTSCVGLGAVREGEWLWRFAAAPQPPTPLTWSGQLTAAQEAAAAAVLTSVQAGRDHLLWAVTGAGKTEMLFPVVAAALAQGQQVGIATPRIDVVRELAPRFAAAFAQTAVRVQYGGAPIAPTPAALVIATSHQMLRYYHAFDLMIVDEVDAFPFPQTPILQTAVRQAARGPLVFLSATPGVAMQRATRQGKLAVSYLPRRFHGAPLPVPQVKLAAAGRLPERLPKAVPRLLRTLQATHRQVMVFVPAIDWLAPVAAALTRMGWQTGTAHASAPDRAQMVADFRAGTIAALVTTSILERGVTIPRCAVLVLAADSPLFGSAGLIQMAGRAGRSAASPDDPVWFVAGHWTQAIGRARAEIRRMNRMPVPASAGDKEG